VASLSALVAAAILRIQGLDMSRKTSLPFGPFLVLGLVSALCIKELAGL
jgi:leader peptidase (prepilin peptidase)/N-methyltransferase